MSMLSLVSSIILCGATIAADDVDEYTPIEIRAHQLAAQEYPKETPSDVKGLLDEFRPLAADLRLAAYVCPSPPVVLFGREGEEDGVWLLYLAQHTIRVFRERYGVENQPMYPSAVFWTDRDRTYDALIDGIGSRSEYLAQWTHDAKAINAFAVYDPAAVGVLEGDSSIMGLNLENNLVHMVGHLALNQYFGVQPFWVREGVGLDLESAGMGTLFSFCAGDKFVPITRKGSFRSKITKYWKRKRSLDVERLTQLTQSDFDHKGSLLVLSVVRYLNNHRQEAFHEFLAAVRADTEANLHLDRFYKVPPERQQELLDQHLGEDWRKKAVATLRAKASKEEVKEDGGHQGMKRKEVIKRVR